MKTLTKNWVSVMMLFLSVFGGVMFVLLGHGYYTTVMEAISEGEDMMTLEWGFCISAMVMMIASSGIMCVKCFEASKTEWVND